MCFINILGKYASLLTKNRMPSEDVHINSLYLQSKKYCEDVLFTQKTWKQEKNPFKLRLSSGDLHFLLSWNAKRTYCSYEKKKKKGKPKLFSVVIVV